MISPICTFSLAGNVLVYTPSQGANREKYFNHVNYKGKMATLAWNKQHSIHLVSLMPRFFIFRRKMYGPNPSKLDIEVFFPAPTQKIPVQIQYQKVFHKKKRLKNSSKLNNKTTQIPDCMLQIYMVSMGVI